MHGLKIFVVTTLWFALTPFSMASEPGRAGTSAGPTAAITTAVARISPPEPTPEQLALLRHMAARDAEPNRMARCADYPDPPGVNWNAREIALWCKMQFDPVLTLAQLNQRFASGGAASLDRYFRDLRDLQKDDNQGWKLDDAMSNTFGCACKEARDLIDAWLAAAPKSPWAWLASGEQYSAAAGEARGTAFFQDTPPERVARMKQLDAKASAAFARALAIDADLTPATIGMAWTDAREGNDARAREELFSTMRDAPGNLAAYMSAASLLNTKWVGSRRDLVTLKERVDRNSARYPALLMVASKMAWDEKSCDGCKWTPENIQALNRMSPSLPVLRELIRQAMTVQDFATSAIYASEVLRLSKTSEIWAHTQRGFARAAMGDLDGANDDGEAALAVNAGYQPALGLMQLLYYKRKAAR